VIDGSVNPYLEKLKNQKIIIFGNDGLSVAELYPFNSELIPKIDEISRNLTDWRNKSMRYFFTGFKATPERTMAWLKSSVLQSNSKILYLIYVNKKTVGHFGLANVSQTRAELDNAIRGEKGGHPDLFKYIEYVLLDIAFNHLRVQKVEGKLFSNNLLAMMLHKQFGFIVSDRSKLKRVEDGEEWHYTSCEEAESNTNFDQLIITLTKDKFLKSTENKQVKWDFDQLK
tara:strand:+ start:14921 stop:15604 length:684 start_codon:yes stop_codon:yes gene_type:complete